MYNLSVKEFTEKIASKVPVPGGGGACAAAASIAAALGDMVGEYTAGKKAYASVDARIRELMAEAQELRAGLLECINEDAESFDALSKAYKIPKDDPSREAVIENCLKGAASGPLKIFRLCMRTIEVLKEFAEIGSKNIISDAATGAALCRGAIMGAAVNIKVNTKLMKDREYAEELNAFVDPNLDKYTKLADEAFFKVYAVYEAE